MIHKFNEITKLHIELSSLCNASCPLCPRNLFGYEFNDGYVERNLTLEDVKKIMPVSFIQQLRTILINGNFGDMLMNPETVEIIEYWLSVNPDLEISISTNGGARKSEFWEQLARLKCIVYFCIDGLEDTHSIYRQGTLYETVIKNAQAFIAAGGQAFWKMIKFDHNEHQIDTAQQRSKELGFYKFLMVDHGRNSGPIFDKHGKHMGNLGDFNTPNVNIIDWYNKRTNTKIKLSNVTGTMKTIKCEVQRDHSIYITSTGEVYPCCYLGFHPRTYGHGNYIEAGNDQLKLLLGENNALEYDLEHCIEWFSRVSETWDKASYEEGRLIFCNDSCGVKDDKKVWKVQ
jgi:MoaA/NifB/PqqE/SkfB family radical SAM enzyme